MIGDLFKIFKKDNIRKSEVRLSKIYHPFWKNFEQKQYSEAVALFAGRLTTNGFDIDWFKDKICLDAGCGSGRYVHALLELEAKEVVGIDIDPAIARNNIKSDNAKIIEGDIRKVPYENEYFDFVCCNGVLHHTENPKEIIAELSRVLKKDGFLFLYVFDPYTQDWELIDKLREANKDVPVERLSMLLKRHLGLPENKLFNFCDLIYAPIQIRFTKEELKELLQDYEVNFFTKAFTDYDRPEENRLIAKKIK